MYTKIVPQLWMLQSREIRDKIALDFKLPKTGISEIRDQDIISDGYCQADLDNLTAERMAEYIGSVETFPRLWEITCMKAYSELHPPTVFIGTPEQLETLQTLKLKKYPMINFLMLLVKRFQRSNNNNQPNLNQMGRPRKVQPQPETQPVVSSICTECTGDTVTDGVCRNCGAKQ